MTDKQIKLDGSFIPIEEAIKAGLISDKDIDVPNKRLDRIDKMEIDLANYEQMERDIEKVIEPYQLNWELDCLSLHNAFQSILERKEQECDELRGVIRKDICSHYVLAECSQKHHNNCVGRNQCIKDLEQECEELKKELDITNCANIEFSLKIKKYQKTIDEIVEIADNNYEIAEMKQIFLIIGGLDV